MAILESPIDVNVIKATILFGMFKVHLASVLLDTT